jgi:hypothetical protein
MASGGIIYVPGSITISLGLKVILRLLTRRFQRLAVWVLVMESIYEVGR